MKKILNLVVIIGCHMHLLAQDKPVIDPNQYLVKTINYDYDLVSGKVNQISYQGGQDDQLLHRYEYDGDNRITTVYTSADGTTWTKEANYQYYAHGPQARTELGALKVETQNHAYTLQGWIKGVQGQNFSYALGYNNTDYKSINATAYGGEQVGLKATPIANNTGGKSTGLYNGNIVTWASLNPKINGANHWTQQFTYDQLNRIKSGGTLNGGDSFRSTYSYDPNGNLKTLERWDKAGAKIDELAYNYEDKKSGYLQNTNRLRSVDDRPSLSGVSSEDLDDQDTDNFQYDDIGNLNGDNQESVNNIEWTVYGKIKMVTRVSDPLTKLPLGTKPHLVFEYDAAGNRVAKISTDKTGKVLKTLYIRDAQGNVLSTYETTASSSLALDEQYLYGNARLGMLDNKARSYQLTDHLGNVRAVVKEANIVASAADYYPFGMIADQYAPSGGYRYGFNGKEKEKGYTSDNYDFGSRIYDARIGRWLSIDPLQIKYPAWTPYNAMADNPIFIVDIDGRNWIISTETENGKITAYNITFTGKILDETNSLTPEKMNEYKDRIVSSFDNLPEKFKDGVKLNFNVDLKVATSESEIDKTDHVFRIVNNGDVPGTTDGKGFGFGGAGSQFIYLNKNILENKPTTDGNNPYFGSGLTGEGKATLERTAIHEVLHTAGLLHPGDLQNYQGDAALGAHRIVMAIFGKSKNIMYQSHPNSNTGFDLIREQVASINRRLQMNKDNKLMEEGKVKVKSDKKWVDSPSPPSDFPINNGDQKYDPAKYTSEH